MRYSIEEVPWWSPLAGSPREDGRERGPVECGAEKWWVPSEDFEVGGALGSRRGSRNGVGRCTYRCSISLFSGTSLKFQLFSGMPTRGLFWTLPLIQSLQMNPLCVFCAPLLHAVIPLVVPPTALAACPWEKYSEMSSPCLENCLTGVFLLLFIPLWWSW